MTTQQVDMRTTITADGVLYEAPKARWKKFVPFGGRKRADKAAFRAAAREQEKRGKVVE